MRSVVIASGQSLTQADVEFVRKAHVSGAIDSVVAISNVGIDLAPWADALVSADTKWWMAHPEAYKFRGMKFSRNGYRDGVSGVRDCQRACNSGLMGMVVARDIYHAREIFLLGFDMHGTHYFGAHDKRLPDGQVLTNTTPELFKIHIQQFSLFTGANVVNCTEGSALNAFPFIPLREAL